MLPTKLQLDVVTPDRKLLSEQVDEVVLPGSEGYLGVLPGHAPLLTALTVGMVQYRKGSETGYLALAWGFAEILPEKVTILADIAEREIEIDIERAEAKKAEVERALRSPGPEFDFAKAQASLQKAIVRIQVATAGFQRRPRERERGGRPGGAPKSDIGQ